MSLYRFSQRIVLTTNANFCGRYLLREIMYEQKKCGARKLYYLHRTKQKRKMLVSMEQTKGSVSANAIIRMANSERLYVELRIPNQIFFFAVILISHDSEILKMSFFFVAIVVVGWCAVLWFLFFSSFNISCSIQRFAYILLNNETAFRVD